MRCPYRRWIVSVLLLFCALPLLAQDAPAFLSQPVGDEAYQMVAMMYDYDRSVPLEARVVERQERDNCVREKIVFKVRDSVAVGWLGIPKTGKAPYSCVLQLHGLTGSKNDWWENDNYISGGNVTNALLAAGVAVFNLDAQYHGERTANSGFENPGEMVFAKHWYNRWRDGFIQTVVECRRALDYLETRAELDKSRIGVIGYSMGGMETFAVTATDKRVGVAVACVAPDTPDPIAASRNFARAVGDRPFLMVMARKDTFYTVEQAEKVYGLIPGSKKELVFYDSDHHLPVEYAPKAVAWLQDGLKSSPVTEKTP